MAGAAEMKTAFPCTQEHNSEGLGKYSVGPFRHPFPNLCQRPAKTTPNTKNYKNRPPKNGIDFRARRVLESPFGPLDSEGGFKIAFSCVRVLTKHQNSTKMKPQ